MRVILILLSLALWLPGCAAPQPGACPLERLAELPLDIVNTVPVVAVEINGHAAALVLDTGSDATVLSRHAAARLGVTEAGGTRSVSGAGGRVQAGEARLDRLGFGAYAANGVRVLLADAPRPPLDGLLGINTLVEFEVELDVPHRRVTLYRARRCLDAAPAWSRPYARLPVRQQPGSGHLFVPVTLENETLSGMLDTGASSTAMSLQTAEDVRIGRKSLARLPAGRSQALNSQGVERREVRLRTMKIGDDVLTNPVLNVIDLPPFAGDLLIGEDYLGTRRVWISFLLGRVWVAP